MRKKELEMKLKIRGIPKEYYNLNEIGRTDERFCLVKKQDGQWQVYYSERGIHTTEKNFGTEELACEYIFQLLID